MNDPKIANLQKDLINVLLLIVAVNLPVITQIFNPPETNFKKLSKRLKLVFYAKHFPTNNQLKFGILGIEY